MIVINSTAFESNLKQNPAITNSMEPAGIYRLNKQKLISDEDLARGITADELLNHVRARMKILFEK